MKNSIILAGVAALAFTAPVLAQPGKGGGDGNGGGGGQQQARGGGGGPQQQARGGGGGPQQQQQARGGGGPQRIDRGSGGSQQARGPERREVRVERRVERQQPRVERQPARVDRQQRVERQQQRVDRAPARQVRDTRAAPTREVRADTRRVDQQRGRAPADTRIVDRLIRNDAPIFRSEQRQAFFTTPTFRSTGLVNGCPPGLAAKGNGCLPPGQAKRLVNSVVPVTLGSALLPPLYQSWYPDNDDYLYRTADGYVYRIDRDRNYVDAYWPVADQWNGAYYVGTAYPQDYLGYYNVPVQYQPWYADTDDYYYRYGDGAIYQVDRQGGVIESIVSLLAGGFGVGQPMPSGYDVYNVPYAYRDRYVDTPDNWYRYNDGYIYEVDPTTRIVQAIVETLV